MPLIFSEKYPSGDEIITRAAPDGADVVVPVTLRSGKPKIIIAFAPIEHEHSYVVGTDPSNGRIPEPEELEAICEDPMNWLAMMRPGGKHRVLLQERRAAPTELVIRHLADQAMDQPLNLR